MRVYRPPFWKTFAREWPLRTSVVLIASMIGLATSGSSIFFGEPSTILLSLFPSLYVAVLAGTIWSVSIAGRRLLVDDCAVRLTHLFASGEKRFSCDAISSITVFADSEGTILGLLLCAGFRLPILIDASLEPQAVFAHLQSERCLPITDVKRRGVLSMRGLSLLRFSLFLLFGALLGLFFRFVESLL